MVPVSNNFFYFLKVAMNIANRPYSAPPNYHHYPAGHVITMGPPISHQVMHADQASRGPMRMMGSMVGSGDWSSLRSSEIAYVRLNGTTTASLLKS